jgi:hypothetical protein
MFKIKFVTIIIFSFLFAQLSKADDLKKEIQKYINDAVIEVRDAETPEEKREILNELFEDLQKSFAVAKNSPLVPEEDYEAINILNEKITSRQNELNGLNGLEKVQDDKLNNFAFFSLQDIEQADTVLTISLTTLLLIIILAILIF